MNIQTHIQKGWRGFTLIELMVVIAIIGILAGIVLTSLSVSQAKARDARRIADVASVKLALELYYNDNLKYPDRLGRLVPNYMSVLPTDPSSSAACTDGSQAGCYFYEALVSGSSTNCSGSNTSNKYHLGATLEVSTNTALMQDYDAPKAVYGAAAPWNGFSQCSNDVNNNSNTDFDGQSVTCAGTSLSSTANSSSADTCYDVSN